ncbi:uncharacterized protein LACBIDRAFT_328038 [Laccaria bicolor S238N-H82]|uniref:Predicted protein n=1 Tax=Laccaria bicolor (strain S238N-H82 / ATCC MYA-4686) TaxID=486041 RepID=B0DE95_LACBS|nr:uncharacterized protein LACBIDRAFT_328038 [Laccaria bicolor S238N-H82]EDR07229.1 predicted protein [Laccaria bicolor S238N-H82]|eukprot:XP_001882160.1 predicted protein [Laccaria bicolor S238N-H82]
MNAVTTWSRPLSHHHHDHHLLACAPPPPTLSSSSPRTLAMADKGRENGYGPLQTESSAEAHRRGPSATWRTNRQYSTVQPAPNDSENASALSDEATTASHSTTAAETTR